MENNEVDTELELELISSEADDLDVDNAPYEIRTLGADFTLELYSKKIENNEIIVPAFQRQYVWPIKKASKLIESFLLGLPVPQVFLYQEASNRDLLVVDGQQRLLTSRYFMTGTFSDGVTPFRLRGVKSKWEGRLFEELDEGDKRRLNNYILRATIFEQINPSDSKSVYEIFERLNTGGMPLTEQEVRNCVNRGTINQFLDNLNTDSSWRSLLGKSDPDKRMKDLEIILRVLALIDNWREYESPMKDFISDYMERNVDMDQITQTRLRELFVSSTSFILSQSGTNAFRSASGRINIAILDSVLTAVSILGPSNISNFNSKLTTLKSNTGYGAYTSNATTDEETVKARITAAIDSFSDNGS